MNQPTKDEAVTSNGRFIHPARNNATNTLTRKRNEAPSPGWWNRALKGTHKLLAWCLSLLQSKEHPSIRQWGVGWSVSLATRRQGRRQSIAYKAVKLGEIGKSSHGLENPSYGPLYRPDLKVRQIQKSQVSIRAMRSHGTPGVS